MFLKFKFNSIEKKILISYVALIITVALFISLFYYIYSLSMLEKQTVYAANSINRIAKMNIRLHKDYLEPLAEKFVFSEAEQTAYELSEIIEVTGGYSLEKFKNNNTIKAITTKNIEVNDQYIGDITIINENKDIIISSDKSILGKNYQDIEDKYNSLYKLVSKGIEKKSFHGYYTANPLKTATGKIYRKYLAAVKIPNTPLFVISSVYVQPYMTPLIEELRKKENKEIVILNSNMQLLTKNATITLLILSLLLLFLLIFAASIISYWLAKKISFPIISLKNAVLKIGQGDFNTTVEESGTDETIQLARTFNKLGSSLKKYISNLAKEIEQRKQVESEIGIARNIQESLLPAVTNEFIRPEFAIHAKLSPAKNVAGDFYDFFYLNEEKSKLAIILGDVSGKGIPAAFFMAITRTLLRNVCLTIKPKNPGILLEKVNNLVCIDNTECMFVTLFVVFYDIPTGTFTYANAGHHAALKLKTDSSIEEFGTLEDTLLGLFSNTKYKNGKITLKTNETVFIYTDGISEATSPDMNHYEIDRIKNILHKKQTSHLDEISDTLFKDVMAFQKNIMFDDMTVFLIRKLN